MRTPATIKLPIYSRIIVCWLVSLLAVLNTHAQCVVVAGSDTTICAGHNVKFKPDTTGGNPTAFAWASIPAGYTSNNRNITVSPAVTTTYILSATGNGCNAVDTVTVTVKPSPPAPVFTYSTDYLCAGSHLVFTTAIDTSLKYKWNFGDGQKDTTNLVTHTYYHYGTDTGYYVASLTVTNAAGCTAKFTDTIAAKGVPHGGILPGTGTDTTTFNGFFTFTRCILAGQNSAGFNFINNNNPRTHVTSTIIWGDTGATFTSDTAWTTLSHAYALGKYSMTYIVTSTVNGCADTLHYDIFVGSNPSVGFGIQGSTSICGLNPIVFYVDNFHTNPTGTVYKVTFNDGTPPLYFGQPPPDSIVHLFQSSSCGFSSTNGINTYANSYSASIVASNPCGITSASVLPIYVSYPPLPGVIHDTVCQGHPSTITNATINGGYASPSGCNTSASILWNVQPNTGWALVGGTLGSDNGYSGPNFDPSLWTAGSNTLNIIFDSLGTFNVILVAANGCGPDTITHSVCITTPPAPSFTLTPAIGCAPFVANAINTTPPVQGCRTVTYSWDITPISRSCINDSVLDYKITGNTNTPAIHFYNEGIYSVRLGAANVCGNFASAALIDTVKNKPHLTINLPGAICAGDSLLPTAQALPCTGTISSYHWTFQGGIPALSDSLYPGNITIVTPGAHTVSFSATNECGARTVSTAVMIDTLPVAKAGPDQTICAGSTGHIGSAPVTGWSYIWNPPTGLSSDTLANPSVVLSNNGTTPLVVTYVLKVSNPGGCFRTDTVNVTVYPNPTVNAGPSKTICAGAGVQLNGTSGGGASAITWSSSNGGTFSNAHSDTTLYTPAIDSGTLILTMSGVTPGSPCPAVTDTLVITVLPVPVANAGPDQQLCSANSVQLGVAPVIGTTYLWSPATGLNSNIIANPTLVLTNTGTTQDTTAYMLTASNAVGCSVYDTTYVVTYPAATVYAGPPQQVCAGQSIPLAGTFGGAASSVIWTSSNGGTFSNPTSVNSTYTPSITIGTTLLTLTTNDPAGPCPLVYNKMIVTVNPTPVANPGPHDTVCNGTDAQLGAASQPGYAYSWSPALGLTDTTVSNPVAILPNTSNGVINQAYTLIVTANGCKDTGHVTVSVFPGPAVNAGPPVSVCRGGSVLLNGTASGATVYHWTSGSGTFSHPDSLITTFIPGINNGIAVARLTVSQIPAVCPATSSSVNITVNPIPVANPGNNDSICNGATTQLGGAAQAGYTYLWQPAAGLSDTTASNPGVSLADTGGHVLNQTYTLIVSAYGCSDTAHVSVSVFPAPVINLAPGTSICPGDSAMLSAAVSGASGYMWSSASGTFSHPDSLQTMFTPGITSGVAQANLTVVPISPVCPATSAGVDVTVNAVPTLSHPFSQSVCSGVPLGAINLNGNPAGTTFTWSVTSPNGVTGFDSTGAGDIIPTQTLVNNWPAAGLVIYRLTPFHPGCTGNAIYDTITVLPAPAVLLPAPQTICSGATTNAVTVSSPVPNTVFSWTATGGNNLSGYTATGTGNIPAQTLVNNGDNIDSVVYVIHGSATGCAAAPGYYTVKVQPAPRLIFVPLSQTVCSGQPTQQVDIRSNIPNANISWTAVIPSGLTGAETVGTNTIPSQIFHNNNYDSLPVPLTIHYTVQITTTGFVCSGIPGNYSITVQPVPRISLQQTQSTGCSPLSVNFVPASHNFGPPDSLTFVWGDNTPNTVLHPNAIEPEWPTTAHVFYNINNHPDTFNVQLIARAPCLDTILTHAVVVLPGVVNAFFTDSPAIGCDPLTVTFRDQSTGAGSLSWCLNYNPAHDSCTGSGRVDTAGTVFTHTFTAGTYTIALIADNGYRCAGDTAYQTVTVIPAPTVHFTFNDSVCAQVPVVFNNQSTIPGGGTPAQVLWNFGNGNTSSLFSPVQTYAAGGVYQVCLDITNSLGCADSLCKPLTILSKPTAAFTFTDTCLNAQPVAFINTSTGAHNYYWSFGDGTFSFTPNPVHGYTAAGNYGVTLIASATGCADTATHTAAVYPVPVATFTLAGLYNCGLPANVRLTNTTAGTNAYTWLFNNGLTSTQINPVATYNTAGTFNISLAAVNAYGCADTATHPYAVYPMPVIDSINISPAQGCQPLNVHFGVTGNYLNNLVWNFGDGNLFTTNAGFTSHYYGDTGTYSVQVTAYSYQNCAVTVTLTDTIVVHINPTAAFDYYINENVEPENGTTAFYNQSQNATTYLWNFGDGTTSTDTNPLHTFNQTRFFNVLLVASTPYGCVDSAYRSIYIIEKSLYVPNVVAPDYNEGSTLVKLWMPAGEGLAEYHAQVFNKWGELLWESKLLTEDHHPAEGWDGTYQGKEVQQDAYVWKVEAIFMDGTRWKGMSYKFQKERKTIGSVTVIR